MIYVLVFTVSLIIALFLIPKIMLLSAQKRILDIPTQRKVHKSHSSRLGGVSFFPAIFLSMFIVTGIYSQISSDCIINSMPLSWLLCNMSACGIVYLAGIGDDIFEISYDRKFVYQIVAAVLIVFSGSWLNYFYGIFGIYALPTWFGMALTVGLLVFIMNAINLIDGINGLSSGLCIIALVFYAIIFLLRGMYLPALFAIATIGALVGFFRFNVFGLRKKKIQIFMGDSGTLLIGAIIGILAVTLLSRNNRVNSTISTTDLVIAYSVLIVPCFDVIRVMLHRFRNKKPVFSPDKNHIHHKLLELGFSHTQTLFLILGLSVGITLLNLLLNLIVRLEFIIVFDIFLYSFANILISKQIKRRKIRAKQKNKK